MNIPCPNRITCPGTDNPFANLSSEAPDAITFKKVHFFFDFPPIGTTYTKLACAAVYNSTISQADADAQAAIAAELCVHDTWIPPGGGDNPPPVVTYFNTAQSCTVACPDGNLFTYTVPAGTYAALSQAEANQAAHTAACQLAEDHKLCLSDLPDSIPINIAATLTIDATAVLNGGTLLWELISGAVPTGMVFNGGDLASTQVTITGTPTVDGSFTFQVKCTANNGDYMVKNYTIIVDALVPFAYYKLDSNLDDTNNPENLNLSIFFENGSHVFAPAKISNGLYPTGYIQTHNTDSPLPLTWELDKDNLGTQGAGFSIRLWVKMVDTETSPGVFEANPAIVQLNSDIIFWSWNIYISRNNASLQIVYSKIPVLYGQLDVPITLDDGNWHLLIFVYDYANDVLTGRYDNGALVTGGAPPTKIMWDSGQLDRFRLAIENYSLTPNLFDPPIDFVTIVDEVAVYKNKVLTSGDMDAEWNAGAGRTWNGTAWV
jgi:hypothetical protein